MALTSQNTPQADKAKASWPQRMRRYLPELYFAIAVVITICLGLLAIRAIPPGHEEVSSLPILSPQKLLPEGLAAEYGLTFEAHCHAPHHPTVIVSSGRPKASFCIGDKSWPLLITSYASGFAYWLAAPIHWLGGQGLSAYRLVGLGFGLVALWLSYVLISRLANRTMAACAALSMSVTSAFVIENGTLFLYETAIWPLLLASLVLLSGPQGILRIPGHEEQSASFSRLVLAGLALGLAFATNVKAVFLVIPLAFALWRRGYRLHRVTASSMIGAGSLFVGALLPLAFFANVGSGDNFVGQLKYRLSLLSRLERFIDLPRELGLFVLFGADLGAYLDRLIAGGETAIGWPGVVVLGFSSLFAFVAAAKLLLRRTTAPIIAEVGLLCATYIFVSLLLYDQFPGGNYAPLHAIYGLIPGLACYTVAKSLKRGNTGWLAYPMTFTAMLPLGWNAVNGIAAVRDIELSVNYKAIRDLTSFIETRSDEAAVVTTTYGYAGVVDAVSGGRISTIQAHLYLLDWHRSGDPKEAEAEVLRRWENLLPRLSLPARIIVPAAPKRVDEPGAEFLVPGILRAAASRNLTVVKESDFMTPTGAAVISLYHLSQPRSE